MTMVLAGLVYALAAMSADLFGEQSDDLRLPPYARMVGYAAADEEFRMDDSLFYAVSRGVVFPVNRYDLNLADSFLVELKDSILPMAKKENLILLAGISIRGAASPEGAYQWNVTLSKRRAQAIIDFIANELEQSSKDILTTNSVAEDYAYLVLCMREAQDPDAGRVGEMVARHGKRLAALKAELQGADEGRLWKRLLATYFPRLRTARLVLFFTRRNALDLVRREMPQTYLDPVPPVDVPHITLPQVQLPEVVWAERRHVLSVSTNLLYDAFYMPNYGWGPMPNVELEYYPKGSRWTLLAAFTSPYYHRWSRYKFFQIRDYHLEVRRYFKRNALHTGLFAAAYVNANIYGVGFSDTKGWEGEGAGGAMKLGYVWRLSRSGRWRMEVAAAVGGYLTRYDPYVYGNPQTGMIDGLYYYDYHGKTADFKKRNHQRTWFGPTELGVRLRYDLLYERIAKRGVSFKRKEVLR